MDEKEFVTVTRKLLRQQDAGALAAELLQRRPVDLALLDLLGLKWSDPKIVIDGFMSNWYLHARYDIPLAVPLWFRVIGTFYDGATNSSGQPLSVTAIREGGGEPPYLNWGPQAYKGGPEYSEGPWAFWMPPQSTSFLNFYVYRGLFKPGLSARLTVQHARFE